MAAEGAVYERLRRSGVQRLRFPIDVYEDAQVLFNQKPKPGWALMVRELKEAHPDGYPRESTLADWEKKGIISPDEEDEPWVLGSEDEFTSEDDGLVLSFVYFAFVPNLSNVEAVSKQVIERPAGKGVPSAAVLAHFAHVTLVVQLSLQFADTTEC